MSRKLQIVLPEPLAAQLEEPAAAAGEPLATLAAHLVRNGVAVAANDRNVRADITPPTVSATTGGRPPWPEPYGGDPGWWQEMWGSIVALHARYPRHLEHLKDGWWEDEAHTETLCAMAIWRAEIDEHGRDPREEIAFHRQLADIAHILRQQGGGVAKTWKPGAPPPD